VHRLLTQLTMFALCTGVAAAGYLWPTQGAPLPPGGYARITVEHPKHGERVIGPNITVRVRSDNPDAAIRLLLDGRPFTTTGVPLDPSAYVQFEFYESLLLSFPIRGLEPGPHQLEVKSGNRGSSLPVVNEQLIEFIVDDNTVR
jgi:hypothetical protein